MATLTETAKVTKKILQGAGVFLVVMIVGRVLLGWSVSLYKAVVPAPPPQATVGFGIIPPIEFPSDSTNLEYKLETVNGGVQSFGPNGYVLPVVPKQTSLLGLERGKQKAAALGFVFEPEQVSGSTYRWTRSQPLPAVLDLDYTLGDFEMRVSWESDPAFLNSRLIPSELAAINEARNYLKKAGALPLDMVNGTAEVTFLKYTSGRLVEAISLSEADFVRVDLYREPIEDVEFVTLNPGAGLSYVIISGSRDQGKRIVEAEHAYTEVDYQRVHTYPLITGDEAWNKLVSGQGYVAQAPKTGNQAVIRRVYLAYLDVFIDEGFIQPVYVFEGDEGFVGYVPAVVDAWLEGVGDEE